VSLHKSVNLLWVYYLAPYRESELIFVGLHKCPSLSFSNYGFHLSFLDILVAIPLTDTKPILSDPILCEERANSVIFKITKYE